VSLQTLLRSTWALDLVTVLLMLAAAMVCAAFVAELSTGIAPQAAYHVYDAPALSDARFFLPARSNASTSSSNAAQAAAAAAGPAAAGRWRLEAGDADMDALASLLGRTSRCSNMWTSYGLLQALVLILMLVR
jgi:zinc transporter 1/2/3